MRRLLALILCLLIISPLALAQDWGTIANISTTMGVKAGRLCVGEASRGDIGCPTYAPSLTTAGDVAFTGGLTTTSISLTAVSTTWGYLGSTGSYLPNFASSAISTSNISLTTINGQPLSSFGGGTSATVISGTTTMVTNFPDAIICTMGGQADVYVMTLTIAPYTVDGRYYYRGNASGNTLQVGFNSNGSYGAFTSSDTNYTSAGNCATTISALYTAGRAFNFIGGSGSSGLGYAITSGTTSVSVNSATAVISLTTGATTWGYLGSTGSYLPNLASSAISTTNISLTTINGVSASSYLLTSSSIPTFKVDRGGISQAVTIGSWTKILFTNKALDTQTNFDTTTSRFTPKIPGNYIFTGSIYCGVSTACWAGIFKNGTQLTQSGSNGNASGSANLPTTAIIVSMNGSTDYVELYVTSQNTPIDGTVFYTNFSGSLLGGVGSSTSVSGSGAGATALSGLTDVALTAPTSGSILTYNAATSKWVNVPIQSTISTTTMLNGYPDAISCPRTDSGSNIFYLLNTNVSGDVMYGANSSSTWTISFNLTTGKYDTSAGSGIATYIAAGSGQCLNTNTTLSQLYASGMAFNFIGGSGAVSSSAGLGYAITSGTTAVTVNSTTAVISLTTGATTWGYLGSTGSYFPNLASSAISATTITLTDSPTTPCNASTYGTFKVMNGRPYFCRAY